MRGCRLMFACREAATDLKFAQLPTRVYCLSVSDLLAIYRRDPVMAFALSQHVLSV